MHVIRHPSLEFNWLPNSITKGLPTPPMVVTDTEAYGGAFYHPNDGEHFGISLRNGLIEISESLYCPSTIAHEYRHYWQLHNGLLGVGSLETLLQLFQGVDTYKESIVTYFLTQPDEMDALCFERKMVRTEYTDEWWEWIIHALQEPEKNYAV